jgi:hypothetical protein
VEVKNPESTGVDDGDQFMSPHWNGYYAGNMMRSVYVLILASV